MSVDPTSIAVSLPWDTKAAPTLSLQAEEDVTLAVALDPSTDITGWTLSFDAYRSPRDPSGGSTPAIRKTTSITITSAGDGEFSVPLSASDLDIEPTLYAYQIWRTNSGAVLLLGSGLLRLAPSANPDGGGPGEGDLEETGSTFILADGSRPFTGNQSMGNSSLTNVANATSNGSAPNWGQVQAAISASSGIGSFTANRTIVSAANGSLSASSVTVTELGWLSGVTSAIQTQLDAKLTAANNLSDLASASTARTNLGLGSAATSSVSAFEAAGAIASHNSSQNVHGLGNLAFQSGTFSGTSSGVNTGDQDLSGLMVKANNLSDVANVATARTNLQLGNLSLQNGTFSGGGTVATGGFSLTLSANSTLSGTNTGDQNLSGYVQTSRMVNGHNLASDVTISKGDVGLGNVENTALSTWAGSTNVVTLGTIATGTWNGTAIADAYITSALTGKTINGLTPTAQSVGFTLAGGTASRTLTINGNATVNGTNTGDQDLSGYVPTSRLINGHNLTADFNVTKGDVGLGVVENTALSTWAGSTSITTLGTITAGTWTGTTIANAYVAAALSGKTYEGLTLAAQSTGFTIAGGTASRTLTVGANASVSGTNTGDQDLSGYVPTTRTVNGHALSANVTISKGDIGLGNAENTALSTWTGSTSITTLGTIATGTWNGTVIANGYLATALTGKTYEGLTLTAQSTGFTIAGGTASRTLTVGANASVSGTNTGDQDLSGYVPISRTVNGHALSGDVTVTKGDVGLGNAENTAISTWAGSTNLVTLGTITTGTWNGSTIANGYVAAALTGKTYNGLTLATPTAGFSIEGNGANLTVLANSSLNGTLSGGGTVATGGFTLTVLANSTINGTLDLSGYVQTSRTVNGHSLSADVTVTKGDVGLGNVENTALSTWAGSTNLVTLGTVTTGTWQGTTIANGYIASALSSKTYDGLTLAAQSVGFTIAGGTTSKTLTINGNATVNGTNTGDQDLSGYVQTSRMVNGHSLSGDVTVTKGDVGLGNAENTAISTWAGSTNLVTLGTITAGTWNGSTIANGYIAAALTGKTYEGLTLATPTAGFSIEGNGANLTVLANSSLNGTLSGGGVVATGGFTITVLANTTLNGTLDLSGDLSGYMLKSNNLSDVSNATTARSNLQLGNLSLQNGTFSGNGALNTSGYSLSLLSNLSIGFNAVTITGNTTLDGTSNLILANNTADIVLSFPSPGSVAGQVFDVVKTSNNTFNVTLNLTLGDAVSPKLNFCGSKAKVVSDGSNYYALSLLKRDELKFNTGNGNGTSAKIRRFGVVELNVGTALSYTDSSANGTSITINEAGTYSVTYTDGHTAFGVNFGISLNSSQLTSAIGVIQAADRIGITTSQGAAAYGCAVATRLLQKGDVVRPHLASTSANDTSNATSFHIVRLW